MKDYFSYDYKSKLTQTNCVFDNSFEDTISDITIAIPTFNRSEMLTSSIQSVIDAFNNFQKIKIELIIIDNNKDSDSFDYLNTRIDLQNLKFRFRYFKNDENIGMFGNWNRALELSNSNLISILNDDDLFDEDIFKVLYPYLEKKHRLYIFQYNTLNQNLFSQKNRLIERLKTFKFFSTNILQLNDYYWGMPTMGSLGVFFERSTALKIGGFPDDFYPINDWVFFSKYIKEIQVCLRINKPLVYYRISENESMKPETADKSLREAYYFRLYLGEMINLKLNHLFARMFILIRFHGNKRLWNISLDLKKYSKEFEINWYHHLLFKPFRYILFFKKLF